LRKRILLLIKVLVSLGLLGLLYSRVDAPRLAEHLEGIDGRWLAVFVGLLYLNSFLSAVKWRLLLAADGILLPLPTLFASYLIGSFFNVFMPSTVGGDVYRLVDVGRRSARAANTAASILADRLSGFLALACYGLFAAMPAREYIQDRRLLLLPAIAAAALLGAAVAVWRPVLLRRLAGMLGGRRREKVDKFLDPFLGSFRVYGARPDVMGMMLLLSFWFQFNAILAVYALGQALGLDVPLVAFAFFVPFVTLLEAIPVSVFGIGLRDTGYVWFMDNAGHDAADAAALSVLYVGVTLVYIAQGGLLLMLRRWPAADRGRGG
jgi:uncharacterized protein (TIRG00374 family)